MKSHSFESKYRLKTSAEFDRVFKEKNSAADGVLVVYGAANDVDYSRLGLVVSRKVGNAVVRNRFKRLLRESFRLGRDELPDGIDLVVIPRAKDPPTLDAMAGSLTTLAARVARKVRKAKA